MPHTRDHDSGRERLSGYPPGSDAAYGRYEYSGRTPGAADQVQQTAREATHKAQERVDQGPHKAAEGIETAADAVRDKARLRGGVTAEYGAKAADAMETSATYLRENDAAAVMGDIQRFVRRHPLQAVAGALVGGFILGRVLG